MAQLSADSIAEATFTGLLPEQDCHYGCLKRYR